MVADMSVGVVGLNELRKELKYVRKSNEKRDELLAEANKLKRIELTNKKPDVMFLFELLEFLKSIPQWSPPEDNFSYPTRPKACFVGESWDGKVTMYRDDENRTDFFEVEGEAIYFDVNYYIKKLSRALDEIYPEVDDL